jgi:hypothetical protein
MEIKVKAVEMPDELELKVKLKTIEGENIMMRLENLRGSEVQDTEEQREQYENIVQAELKKLEEIAEDLESIASLEVEIIDLSLSLLIKENIPHLHYQTNILLIPNKNQWKSNEPFAILTTTKKGDVYHRLDLVKLGVGAEKLN